MQDTQIDNSPIKIISPTRNFLMSTLMKEKKPVVLVNYEFEYRKKNQITAFSLEFSDCPDSDAREKNNICN